MKQQQAQPPSRRWTVASILGVVFYSLLLLVVLPIVAGIYWNQPALWVGLPICYFATAVWLRSRLMICTLIGLVLGAMLIDGDRKHQSETYQVWQPVWAIGVGLLIGLIIGVIWDRAQNIDDGPKRTRPQKRR